MKTIITTILLLLVLLAILFVGSRKQELAECTSWLDDSGHYPNSFYSDWQIEQCKSYGVELR